MGLMNMLASLLLNDGRTQENLHHLGKELKDYAQLQVDYVKLDLVEKLTRLLSFIAYTLALFLLCLVALFFAAFALAHYLAPIVGGLMMGYSLIAVGVFLLVGLVVVGRTRLIVRPLIHYLAGLFWNE